MARRRKAKRSLAALPKGLPQRRNNKKHPLDSTTNPFEVSSRQKRAKHEVHNRSTSSQKQTSKQTALAKSIQRRQSQLKDTLATSHKANAFVDRRIGEYSSTMNEEHKMMARLVKERSRRSKRAQKYSLEDDDE
jgi:nucleolar protein 14